MAYKVAAIQMVSEPEVEANLARKADEDRAADDKASADA